VNVNILLFNNMIYGLTKGQYSPTSEVGKVTKSSPYGSLDQPFNAVSLALGAEASFVARTHDMDRKHMQEMFRRAHAHNGASLVEVFQNCNVFNDGQFDAVNKRDVRDAMLINLVDGEPITFGVEKERGVMIDSNGSAVIVDIAEVGTDALIVHDEKRPDPAVAFALSRLASGPTSPTPVGVFRSVDRIEYAQGATQQLAQAQEAKGAGDLATLLRSNPTWEVG